MSSINNLITFVKSVFTKKEKTTTQLTNVIQQTKEAKKKESDQTTLPVWLRDPKLNIARPCLAVDIRKTDLQRCSIEELFSQSFLVCRNVVDHENYEGNIVQIIPYVVCENSDEILTYCRGSKSQSDLVSKYSIGFGGHVDQLVWPSELDVGTTSKFNLSCQNVIAEIYREIKEELGIEINENQKLKLNDQLKAGPDTKSFFIIPPVKSEVKSDARHIGLCLTLELTAEQKNSIKPEESHIRELAFINIRDLAEQSVKDLFESWSATLITFKNIISQGGVIYTPSNIEEQMKLEEAIYNGDVLDTRDIKTIR